MHGGEEVILSNAEQFSSLCRCYRAKESLRGAWKGFWRGGGFVALSDECPHAGRRSGKI